MQTLETIKKRIHVTEDLHSLVKTMKTLAAVSIRQYENIVRSVNEYHRTVEMGIQILLQNRPRESPPKQKPGGERLGVIILGSDQGLCGSFNDRIASYALAMLDNLYGPRSDRKILVVGTRVLNRIEEMGQPVDALLPAPGSPTGFIPLVQRLLMKMESWQTGAQIGRFLLFFNQPSGELRFRPHHLQLLPLDVEWFETLGQKKWPTHGLPTFTMDRPALFFSLIQQYLFVLLFRALAESLMSEHASRLASMQVAEKNIEERLEALIAQFQQERQTAITEELLDIVGGFEALTGELGEGKLKRSG